MRAKSLTYLVTLAVLAACSDQSPTPNQPALGPRFAVRQLDEKAALLSNLPISQGSFSGSLSITHIAYDEASRELRFSGTVTRASDGVTDRFTDVPGTLSRAASASVSSSSAITPAQVGSNEPCDLLSLGIQPIDLDVLGLTLELTLIGIDVHGVPGPGNALGNLLCSVVGLIDSAAAATRAIQAQLDQTNRMLAPA